MTRLSSGRHDCRHTVSYDHYCVRVQELCVTISSISYLIPNQCSMTSQMRIVASVQIKIICRVSKKNDCFALLNANHLRRNFLSFGLFKVKMVFGISYPVQSSGIGLGGDIWPNMTIVSISSLNLWACRFCVCFCMSVFVTFVRIGHTERK